MRRLAAICVVMLIVAAACAQDNGDTEGQQEEDGAGQQTRTLQIDANPEGFEGFALQFFPDQVRVRPGDTVEFTQDFTGEPHSVTMGTLVDETVPQLRGLGPEEEPPEDVAAAFGQLPVMLPEGPGDANQAAVNPCYLEDAPLPEDPSQPCEVSDLDDFEPFDGTQAYYSSGFVPQDGSFSVELSGDIEEGTYAFYCNLHGPSMSGVIEVVGADDAIPSQEQLDQRAAEQIEEAFAPLQGAYEAAQAGEAPFGTPLAGFGSPDAPTAGIMEFIPSETEVAAGEDVTWTVVGPHTISFNPPVPYPLVQADDGTWHLSEEAAAPAGGPGMPPPPEGGGEGEGPPPEGPPEPTNIDGGSWDGQGYRSSGFIISFPGEGTFFSYTLTFTEPGEYPYVCLIHPKMTGTITVS